jgi:hypothetical protein
VHYLVDPFTEEAELDKNDVIQKIEEFINAGKLLTDPKIQLYFLTIIY